MPILEATPRFSLELDKPRTHALTLRACRLIEESTGHSITDVVGLLESAPLTYLGRVLWATLLESDREGLTVEEVEEMIHPGNLLAAIETMQQLLKTFEALGGAEGKAHAAAPAAVASGSRTAKASTSKSGGRSASSTSASRTLSSGT